MLDIAKDWRNPRIKTKSMWLTREGDFGEIDTARYGDQKFHGKYHPEIPFQMILRYTVPGEVVLDPFSGSGTTIDVGQELGRVVIGTDISPSRSDIVEADATRTVWYPRARLAMLHPPYWNMIKFTDNKDDLGNQPTVEGFVSGMATVLDNVKRSLLPGGWVILVISDVYNGGCQHPLAAMLYPAFTRLGLRLKGKIIKDFGETKGSSTTNARTKNLWRYRALKSGFWELGLDEIWVYQDERR